MPIKRVLQPVDLDRLAEIVEATPGVVQVLEAGNEWWIIHESRQSRPAAKAKQTRPGQ
jgi:hypothetical protein